MERTISGINYCIELTNEQFTAIEKKDDLVNDPLYMRLAVLGCENVEYNGHFGANVFFTLEGAEHETTLLQVEKTIADYLL